MSNSAAIAGFIATYIVLLPKSIPAEQG